MKQYGCFRAIFMSFYSADLYRDVAKNWGAGVLLYLLLVLTLCWGAMMFRIQPTLNLAATQFIDSYLPQLPASIRFEKGVATTAENHPYFIRNPKNQELIAIIDTSGKYTDLHEAHVSFLLTQHGVSYADNNDVIKTQTFSKNMSFTLFPPDAKAATLKFVGWAWALLLPFFILVAFAYRLVQSVFYAVLGKLVAVLADIHLCYSDVWKLAVVAITPVIILSTVLDWFEMALSYHLLLYFVLAMVYLMFAIRSNKVR